jgi:hypothetical protein
MPAPRRVCRSTSRPDVNALFALQDLDQVRVVDVGVLVRHQPQDLLLEHFRRSALGGPPLVSMDETLDAAFEQLGFLPVDRALRPAERLGGVTCPDLVRCESLNDLNAVLLSHAQCQPCLLHGKHVLTFSLGSWTDGFTWLPQMNNGGLYKSRPE